MSAIAVEQGTLLAGKYRLTSILGRGGMGSVWRAEHLELSAPVAVKLIDPSIARVPEALARFQREAKAAASLRSPHVVQILDYGVDPETTTPFIVMELMEGESLASRLERGPLSPRDTAEIFSQVARALTRAHAAGIVHRDLKPDNIFLVRNEDEEVAKVLDFGIAKAEGVGVAGAATATGMVMGTAYYMSPEQVRGTKDTDYRTDLWALGVIAHEALTGRRPFDSQTLGDLVIKICMETIPAPSTIHAVPAGFDAWFARAVSRDLATRFQSAREMADALREVCHAGDAPQLTTGVRAKGLDTQPLGSPLVAAAATSGGVALETQAGRAKKPPIALFVVGTLLLLGAAGAAAMALLPQLRGETDAAPTNAATSAPVGLSSEVPPALPSAAVTVAVPVASSEPSTAVAAAAASADVAVAPSVPVVEPPRHSPPRPGVVVAPPEPPAPPPEPPPPPAPRPVKKKSSLEDILDTRK